MVAFTVTDHNTDSTDASSYTPTVSIGSGGAERTIVICAGGRAVGAGITNTGITVATKTSAEVIKHTIDAGSSRCHMVGMYIISAADFTDPTATSVALVISFSATISRCGWGVAVTADPMSLTAFDTNSGGTAAAGTVDVPIDTPASGAALGFAFDSSSSTPDLAWTNLTKDYEDLSGEGGGVWSEAGADNTSAVSALAVSVAGSSNTGVIAIAASFAAAAGGLSIPVAMSDYRQMRRSPGRHYPPGGDYIRRKSGLYMRDTKIERAA